MILNVHNLDSLQPLIMVMGLGADTSLKAIMCQLISLPYLPSSFIENRGSFSLGNLQNWKRPTCFSDNCDWKTEAIWGLALLGCFTRILSTLNQKLRDPTASDVHEVSARVSHGWWWEQIRYRKYLILIISYLFKMGEGLCSSRMSLLPRSSYLPTSDSITLKCPIISHFP